MTNEKTIDDLISELDKNPICQIGLEFMKVRNEENEIDYQLIDAFNSDVIPDKKSSNMTVGMVIGLLKAIDGEIQ